MRGRYSIYKMDACSLLMHFESIWIICDLVSRGEWSVQILLNKEKCCCWLQFFYNVTQSYVFHIQKMRKRPTRHEVHWNKVIRLPVSNVLSGLNFSSNLPLFRLHFSKIDCLHFKGEGGKLGDLICAFCRCRCVLATENCSWLQSVQKKKLQRKR